MDEWRDWAAMADRARSDDLDGRDVVVLVAERLDGGGAERQLCLAAMALARRGLPVRVLALRPVPDTGAALRNLLEDAGLPLEILSTDAAAPDMPALPAGWRDPVGRLAAAFLRLRPRAVVAFLDRPSLFAGLAALVASVPAVLLSARNVAPVHFPQFFAGQTDDFHAAYAVLARAATVGLSANGQVGAASYADWLGVPTARFALLPNLMPSSVPADCGVSPPHVLGVFRLSAEKRPLLFVAVMARLARLVPGVRATMLGDGPLRGQVAAAIAAAGLEDVVELAGHVDDVPERLRRAALLLHVAEHEGCPNAVLEAQAAGLPVVVAAEPALRAVLPAELVDLARPAADVDGLARSCRDLLLDAGRRRHLGQIAARHAAALGAAAEKRLFDVLFPPDEVEAASVAAAEALRRSGRAERAAALLARAVTLCPDSVVLWNHLGLARRSACDDQGSLAAFARAALLRPDDVWAETNMAFSLLRRPPDRRAAFGHLDRAGEAGGGLGLFCDRFPHTYGFLLQQFQTYLRHFPDAHAYSFGRRVLEPYGRDQFDAAMAAWAPAHADIAGRVRRLQPELDRPDSPGHARLARLRVEGGFVRPALAHNIFAMNADLFLPLYETLRIPFTFTLNPGGGFRLDDSYSDACLRRVFESPWFRRVIVTYGLTRDYIRARFQVPDDAITLIPGTIVLESTLMANRRPKRRYGVDKDSLDICFGGLRYTPKGTDKGYDLFLAAAERLGGKYPHACFHVFGDFTPDLLDVARLAGRIRFHGLRSQAWLAGFYADMDVIVSPNRPHDITRGAFDGFPVTTCIEAAMCGVALFASDPMGLNFALTDGYDYVAVNAEAEDLTERLDHWLSRPDDLYALAAAGERTTREVWGEEAQMTPRVQLFSDLLRG